MNRNELNRDIRDAINSGGKVWVVAAIALALTACDSGDGGGGVPAQKLGAYPDNHPCSIDFDCAQGLVCSQFSMCAPIPCRYPDTECPKSSTNWDRSCVNAQCRNECSNDQQCVDLKPPFTKCENRICTTPVSVPVTTQDTSSADSGDAEDSF